MTSSIVHHHDDPGCTLNQSSRRRRPARSLRRPCASLFLLGPILLLAPGGCPLPGPDGDQNSNLNSNVANDNGDVGGPRPDDNVDSNDNAPGSNNNTGGNSNTASNDNSNPVGNDNTAGENSNDNANGNDNAGNQNDNGSDNGEIANSATSITASDGGAMTDPEGVAAPEGVMNIRWKDARGADRTLALGSYLHQYDFSFDDGRQIIARSANDDAYGHPGFGYVVSHNNQNGNSPLGKSNVPSLITTHVFDGGHHATHRIELLYDRDKEGGGYGVKVPLVIEWFVATGRDHPVWSVTWKMDQVQNPNNVDFDAYRMDVRGPYGSLNFDGAPSLNDGDAIGGVAWGDADYLFTTTDAQLSANSPWLYDIANSVCFTRTWTANVNAEMAIVQTRVGDRQMGYGDRVVGRERGQNSAANFTNKGDCAGFGDNRAYSLPCINGWPYQLMNFDWYAGGPKPLGEATGTKLIAWGTPYGWLGASSFYLFDFSGTADGRGERSYATFIVLGPKGRYNAQNGQYDLPGDASRVIDAVEALAAATIGDVTAGSIATQAPRGPGAVQMKSLVNGYDDTYAAFRFNAVANRAAFTIFPAAGRTIEHPIIILSNYSGTKLPTIRFAGATLSLNDGTSASGAFVSRNSMTNELWITINANIAQSTAISIE